MTATQPVAEITSIRKGDGHPHLIYGGFDTLCGRTLHENRWATITHFDAALTARLAANGSVP